MTRTDLIALMENVIEKLDELRARMPEGDDLEELDNLRNQISAQQLQLIQVEFDENTVAFQEATADLAAVNKELKATIEEIGQLVETIENLKKFVTAVDQVLGTVAAIV